MGDSFEFGVAIQEMSSPVLPPVSQVMEVMKGEANGTEPRDSGREKGV